MPRRLVSHVHVHSDDGTSRVFGPGDVVPGWAARQITNPKAWSGEDDDTVELPVPAPSPDARPLPVEPPRKGRGASREAWTRHADALGVTYLREASRDEIIAAIDTR